MRISEWIEKNTASLLLRTVAVSGSTGGLGRELCFYFAGLGASLVLVDRNPEKSRALGCEIRKRYPDTEIRHVVADMEKIEDVRAAADELLALDIDHLVLNAGAYSIPRHKCDTGYDNVFQINFVSPYYLAKRLLPHIREKGGKVVAVGSIAHNYSVTDPEDVDFSTRKKASKVYGNAKRYLMFSLSELSGGDLSVSLTHPGITFTNITAHYPKPIFAIIKYPMKLIFMKPRRAALCILRGVFEDCGRNEWIGPRFFGIWGGPRRKRLNTCKAEEAERIFAEAERIISELCDK